MELFRISVIENIKMHFIVNRVVVFELKSKDNLIKRSGMCQWKLKRVSLCQETEMFNFICIVSFQSEGTSEAFISEINKLLEGNKKKHKKQKSESKTTFKLHSVHCTAHKVCKHIQLISNAIAIYFLNIFALNKLLKHSYSHKFSAQHHCNIFDSLHSSSSEWHFLWFPFTFYCIFQLKLSQLFGEIFLINNLQMLVTY